MREIRRETAKINACGLRQWRRNGHLRGCDWVTVVTTLNPHGVWTKGTIARLRESLPNNNATRADDRLKL